jgi:uncharacterized protein YukE
MRIEVDGESLASLASLLRTRSNEATELAAQLRHACSTASGGIGGGKAVGAFHELEAGWSGQLSQLSTAMANVAAALDAANQTYQETDAGSMPRGPR